MRTAHVRQHVTPVVVVLNEIALRKAHAVGHAAVYVDAVYAYIGNRVVLGPGAKDALNSALARRGLVDCGRRE